MAGGLTKYRHLSRDSAHRRALLRNLVTSLIEHESISTSWHKAKEAQRLAEKLITLGKKNTEASKRSAMSTLFVSEFVYIRKETPLLLTYLSSALTKCCPNSSARCENATPTGPEATPACSGSSP
jgi:large subunit ribosomal protein L17